MSTYFMYYDSEKQVGKACFCFHYKHKQIAHVLKTIYDDNAISFVNKGAYKTINDKIRKCDRRLGNPIVIQGNIIEIADNFLTDFTQTIYVYIIQQHRWYYVRYEVNHLEVL